MIARESAPRARRRTAWCEGQRSDASRAAFQPAFDRMNMPGSAAAQKKAPANAGALSQTSDRRSGRRHAVESVREDAIGRRAAFGAALHLDRVDVPAFARRRVVAAETEAELRVVAGVAR